MDRINSNRFYELFDCGYFNYETARTTPWHTIQARICTGQIPGLHIV